MGRKTNTDNLQSEWDWWDVRQIPPSRVERMHYSLWSAGLGRTSVGRVLSVRGSGRVCLGSSGSRSRFALISILEPQETVPSGSNSPWGAKFIVWRRRRSFLGEPDRAQGILEPLGVSRLRPCARTRLKKGLVPHSSDWWDMRQIPITSKLHDSTWRTFLTVV